MEVLYMSKYKTIDVNLPFYHYYKTIEYDSDGNIIKKDKKVIQKTGDELMNACLIVGVSAAAINMITNGISHLIYSVKKKRGK